MWMNLYKFKGESFLHVVYRSQNGNYLANLFFLGSKEKAKEFEYHVQIQDSDKTERFCYSTSAIPVIGTSSFEIKRQQKGLLLTEEVAKRCVTGKKNSLIFSYQVKKISNLDTTLLACAGPSLPKIRRTTVPNNDGDSRSKKRESI